MPRMIEKSNWRVEVYAPWPIFSDTEAAWRAECDHIAQQIKRHVDGFIDLSVQYDSEAICDSCGRTWTEGDDSPHNGGCCADDVAYMPEEY